MSCRTGSTLVPKWPYYSFIWATDKGFKTKSNLVLLSDASAPLTTCKKYIRGNAGLVSSKYTDYGGRYFFCRTLIICLWIRGRIGRQTWDKILKVCFMWSLPVYSILLILVLWNQKFISKYCHCILYSQHQLELNSWIPSPIPNHFPIILALVRSQSLNNRFEVIRISTTLGKMALFS